MGTFAETQVRLWLDNPTGTNAERLQEWIRVAPQRDVTDLLAKIAGPAQPVSNWNATYRNIAMTMSVPIFLFCFYIGLIPEGAFILGVSLIFYNVAFPTNHNIVPVRAAIQLALLKDVRALPPLMHAWRRSFWNDSAICDQIEDALVLLFTDGTVSFRSIGNTMEQTERFIQRIWGSTPAWKDLSDRQADLVLAAVRYLHRSDTQVGVSAMQWIADKSSLLPNRRAVIETTRTLSAPPPADIHIAPQKSEEQVMQIRRN